MPAPPTREAKWSVRRGGEGPEHVGVVGESREERHWGPRPAEVPDLEWRPVVDSNQTVGGALAASCGG